jgi:hypothetical protein
VVLYVDGTNAAQTTIVPGSGILSSTNSVSIGSRQSAAASYDLQFVGLMEEVAIYSYALSSNQVGAHHSAVSNRAPVFVNNPFTEPAINAGQPYSATIATNASDPNGDAITFSKVSGPTWLAVAGNGALSGAPANFDAGTNTFIVRATDPGGLYSNAALFIYVNGAPSFTADPFTGQSANAGEPYSATIATNASDPNGDAITFSKVSGPTWLAVAGNGALSGTPANLDAGTNTFVVRATDPGGLYSNATLFIYVNGAPSFTADPFTGPSANAGQSYAGTIASNATDPNGDALSFAKVSGPAWLSVLSDGGLSGMPLSNDVGTNSFIVSVTDPGALSGSATLNLIVTPAPPIVAALALQSTNALLSWTGGIAPYQVQMTTNLSSLTWQPFGPPTNATSLLVPASDPAGFYRILGQ